MSTLPAATSIRYAVSPPRVGWELTEETMPESVLHDEAVAFLKALLTAWASRSGGMQVARNLAVRWSEVNPRIGVDPDVCVLSPPPPEGNGLRSLRTWEVGHAAPLLAVEVVSETNPRKDYVVAPDKYAASGTRELWIFDPLLAGPASHGGPFRLQVWVRTEEGTFTRVYAGEGPVRSETVRGYLVVVDEGRKLRITEDASATAFWLTAEEAERAAKEEERAAKEAALARIAALEAELANRTGR